jgi:catechol 2,3-dioxygenase-like lactoylglutathione lyase family enzyme
MIRQLAHLNFVTNDLSKIIDFYVNKLGMKVKFTLNNKEGKQFGYYFECGNSTFLEFFDQRMAWITRARLGLPTRTGIRSS